MNSPLLLSADIETTILVAVWSEPIIFQGYFKITLHEASSESFIFYRAVCEAYHQENFLDEEFFPDQFQFSHIYNQSGIIKKQIIEPDAVYLLNYALFITVTQMLKNKKQYLTYIDEVALNAIMERTSIIINKPVHTKLHDDLGFSVNMNFQAREKNSEDALTALIQLAK